MASTEKVLLTRQDFIEAKTYMPGTRKIWEQSVRHRLVLCFQPDKALLSCGHRVDVPAVNPAFLGQSRYCDLCTWKEYAKRMLRGDA